MGKKGNSAKHKPRKKRGESKNKCEWRHSTLEIELAAIGLRIKEVSTNGEQTSPSDPSIAFIVLIC
jgi:hypothetical protein